MEPQDAKSARMKRKHALLHRESDKKNVWIKVLYIIYYILLIRSILSLYVLR